MKMSCLPQSIHKNGKQDQLQDNARQGIEESAGKKCLECEMGFSGAEQYGFSDSPYDAPGDHA